MFGIGFFELLVIAVFALIFVGPKKLPDVMRQAGKFFVQIRRTTNDVRSTFEQVVRDAEEELRREEIAQMRALIAGKQATTNDSGSDDSTATPPALDPGHRSDGTLIPASDTDSERPAGSKTYNPFETRSPLTQDATWQPLEPAAQNSGANELSDSKPHTSTTSAPAAPDDNPPAKAKDN